MSKKRDSFPPDVQGTQSLINMNNSKKEWFTGCCESLQGCEIRPSRGAHLQQDSVSYEKVLCFLAPESELTLWAALTSGIWQTWPSSSFHTLGLRSWDHHVRVSVWPYWGTGWHVEHHSQEPAPAAKCVSEASLAAGACVHKRELGCGWQKNPHGKPTESQKWHAVTSVSH